MSLTSPQTSESGVGTVLRRAREQQRLSIEDVANSLCIRTSHVRAIEDGDYSQLPALVYARGFVRSYAEFLKLDSNDVLTQFRSETAGSERPLDAVYIPTNSNRQLPSMRVIVLSALAFVLVLIIWSILSAPAPESTIVDTETVGIVDPPIEEGTELAPVKNAEPQNIYTPQENTQTPVIEAPQTSIPVTLDPLAAEIPPAEQPPSGIVLEALSDAWVEIKDSNGTVVYSRVLRSGETYNVPPTLKGATMSTGNAGGIAARINGKRAGVLGKQGEVMHNIAINARDLTSMAR